MTDLFHHKQEEKHEHKEEHLLHRMVELLEEIAKNTKPKGPPPRPPQLRTVKIVFGENNMAQGAVTLKVGQKTKATLLGFDQNGQPMPADFVMPQVSYTVDNPSLDSVTPDGANGADIVSLAEGVANLTATVMSAEGRQLSDTETMTNQPGTVTTPVLSSVKIDFTTPA